MENSKNHFICFCLKRPICVFLIVSILLMLKYLCVLVKFFFPVPPSSALYTKIIYKASVVYSACFVLWDSLTSFLRVNPFDNMLY